MELHIYYELILCIRNCVKLRNNDFSLCVVYCLSNKYYSQELDLKHITIMLDKKCNVFSLDGNYNNIPHVADIDDTRSDLDRFS